MTQRWQSILWFGFGEEVSLPVDVSDGNRDATWAFRCT